MVIYEFDDYKAFIKAWVEEKKQIGQKVTFQSLAQKSGVQKAYLSRVLNANAHLSADQAYLVCEATKLSEEESEYFFLLLEIAKTGLKKRKSILLNQKKEIQKNYFKTDTHMSKESLKIMKGEQNLDSSYYLNPYNQVIHMALTIDRFSNEPEALRIALGLSKDSFNGILDLLLKQGFVTISKGKIIVLESGVHLKRGSSVFWPWYQQMVNLTQQRGRALDSEENLNFTVTFSADSETFSLFKSEVLKLLEKFQKRVEKASSKELYQLSFDVMNWQL